MKKTRQFLQENDMDGFDVERLRKKLLSKKKYRELRSTYQKGYPELSDGNTGEFWDQRFNEIGEIHHMEVDRNRKITDWIIKRHLELGIKNIVDLGVGKGHVEHLLYKDFSEIIHITGTDITVNTLNTLKKKFSKWKFIKSPLTSIKLKKESADLVLLLEVLEHIKPTETFIILEQIHNLLRSKGWMILSIPVNEGLEEMYPVNPNQHQRVYSEELIRYELEEAGFEIIDIIRLTAFPNLYFLKSIINSIFKFRHANNLIIFARKRK